MQKYTCLIVDDEKLAQELLESYVQKLPNLEVVACCSTAMEAMVYLTQQAIDLLFLDIEMPDLSGLDFLRSLKKTPATILTTAYSEYALEGFELSVVDYLLKPIEFERFFRAVTKAISGLQKASPMPMLIPTPVPTSTNETPPSDYFFVKADNKIVRVVFDDILFIEALQKYIRIHTAEKRIVTLISLSKIQEDLPERQFIRIHRSYIINIDKIDNIEGNMVRMGKHKLPISKGQREVFMEKIREKGMF